MVILTGPSASGKTDTCRYLQSHYGIVKAVTHTTRAMRVNEKNGVDYHFVSDEEFENMVKNGEFIENVVYNHTKYGTSKKEVRIDKCMALEINGAMTYKNFHDPKIVIFFLDLDEKTCKERMLSRGDSPEKVEERLNNDKAAFHLTDEQKASLDGIIDTKKHTLPEVAKIVYDRYMEILKERGIDYQKELQNLN